MKKDKKEVRKESYCSSSFIEKALKPTALHGIVSEVFIKTTSENQGSASELQVKFVVLPSHVLNPLNYFLPLKNKSKAPLNSFNVP